MIKLGSILFHLIKTSKWCQTMILTSLNSLIVSSERLEFALPVDMMKYFNQVENGIQR